MYQWKSPHVKLALETIEAYIKTKRTIAIPADTPPELLDGRAGVFVSLHSRGALRGCIGTIEPTQASIAVEIVQNAISACSRDPRFDPVEKSELEDLECSVDVLSPAEPVTDMTTMDHKRYGVIVQSGYRRGLLLPNLEGVDTVERQISIALQKAGIITDEPYNLSRFEVVRFH